MSWEKSRVPRIFIYTDHGWWFQFNFTSKCKTTLNICNSTFMNSMQKSRIWSRGIFFFTFCSSQTSVKKSQDQDHVTSPCSMFIPLTKIYFSLFIFLHRKIFQFISFVWGFKHRVLIFLGIHCFICLGKI